MSTVGHYPTEVRDAPWEVLQLVLPPPTWRPGGPGRKPMALRRVSTGMVYVPQTGCPWRMIPTPSGHGHTLSGSLRRWRGAGRGARGMATLRQWARQSPGRLSAPSAGGAESQRLKTATHTEAVGFDGNKKIPGRKRPLLVDPLGLSVAVVVTAAPTDDRLGVGWLWQRYCASGVQRLRPLWGDGGSPAQWWWDWGRRLTRTPKVDLAVVAHTGKGCQVVQHRWKVARTCVWWLKDRRHSRDYETLTVNSEAMMQIRMIRLLLKRRA